MGGLTDRHLAAHDLAEEIRGDLYELFLNDIKEPRHTFGEKKVCTEWAWFPGEKFLLEYSGRCGSTRNC